MNNYYKVNGNVFNVTTTCDSENESSGWSIENIAKSEFTIDSLIETLQVVDIFKKKYPNDETFTNFEECVREEICNIFGGTTLDLEF